MSYEESKFFIRFATHFANVRVLSLVPVGFFDVPHERVSVDESFLAQLANVSFITLVRNEVKIEFVFHGKRLVAHFAHKRVIFCGRVEILEQIIAVSMKRIPPDSDESIPL